MAVHRFKISRRTRRLKGTKESALRFDVGRSVFQLFLFLDFKTAICFTGELPRAQRNGKALARWGRATSTSNLRSLILLAVFVFFVP